MSNEIQPPPFVQQFNAIETEIQDIMRKYQTSQPIWEKGKFNIEAFDSEGNLKTQNIDPSDEARLTELNAQKKKLEVLIDRWVHGRGIVRKQGILPSLASIPLAVGYEGAKALAFSPFSVQHRILGRGAIKGVGTLLGDTPISPEHQPGMPPPPDLWTVDETTRPPSYNSLAAYLHGLWTEAHAPSTEDVID